MIGKTGTKPDGDGDFSKSPYFKFNDDKVKFDTKYVDNANDNYGSASGLIPKSLLYRKAPRFGGAFLSLLRTNPTTKHSPDLINQNLQGKILLCIKRSCIFHEAHEKAE